MTDVERYSGHDLEVASDLPWWELIEKVAKIVDVVVRTPFVSSALRGNTAAATAAVMYGHELGIGPMTALNKLDVIDGSVQPSAELAVALAARAGEVWVEQESEQSCTVAARRYGSDVVHRVTWTIADARRAGLLNRANWRSYPQAMLYARASAAVVRRAFPDVLGGITSFAEERDDEHPVELQPELPQRSRTTSRRRAPHRHSMDDVAAAPEASQSVPERPGDDGATLEPQTQPDEPGDDLAPVTFDDERTEPVEQRPPRRSSRPTLPGGEQPPSSNALGAMHALFNACGIEKAMRQSRLDLTSEIIGRTVETSNELTAAETAAVLDALTELADHPTWLHVDEIGRYTIRRPA